MAKHPTSSRVHRDPEPADDAFVAGLQRTATWARAHDRQLIVTGVVLAILVALGLYWINAQRQLEQQAAARLAEVQQSVVSGNVQLAIRDLQTYLDTFGGTEAAQPARLLLADVLLGEGRAEEAVEALGDLPEDLEEPLGIPAARLLAAAQEELGNIDRAVEIHREIAGSARFPFERREALADAARVRLQNGNPEAAADLYQEVVDTFQEEQAPQRGYYEMWLAEARAQAEEGAAGPTTPDTTAESAAAEAPTG